MPLYMQDICMIYTHDIIPRQSGVRRGRTMFNPKLSPNLAPKYTRAVPSVVDAALSLLAAGHVRAQTSPGEMKLRGVQSVRFWLVAAGVFGLSADSMWRLCPLSISRPQIVWRWRSWDMNWPVSSAPLEVLVLLQPPVIPPTNKQNDVCYLQQYWAASKQVSSVRLVGTAALAARYWPTEVTTSFCMSCRLHSWLFVYDSVL